MYTTVVHNQKLVDSMDVEQLVGRADCKAICKFSTAQKVGALMSLLFKGQLYIQGSTIYTYIRIYVNCNH